MIGNVIKTLAKSVLISLGLTAAASATDAAIHKEMFGSGNTALINVNAEMNDIMKISLFKKLVDWSKAIAKQLKMKQRDKKEDFSKCC